VTLDLAEVKKIKNAVPGATVNDAVLAMVGGAMRRYLEDKNELPDKSLMTLAPVNTREKGAEATAAGNTISMLTFPLCTDIDDPIERLAAICAATAESKAIQSAIGAKDLTDVQKFAPPATLGLAGRLVTMTGSGGRGPILFHNCTVTNVPGPNQPLYMLGAKLAYWCGMGPVADGMSLLWNPTSYCGQMFISLTSAPNIVPDPDFLAQCLKDSYEEMKAAAEKANLHGKVEDARPVAAKKPARKAPKAAAGRKAPQAKAAGKQAA
jgi:WS/DGAT/MGAT family acyltransferase